MFIAQLQHGVCCSVGPRDKPEDDKEESAPLHIIEWDEAVRLFPAA
jgi:hypothetical protein